MKIFNWMHRNRVRYPAEVSLPEDGSSGRKWGSSSASFETQEGKTEREPLLDEAGGDWELDGILTIGTLAIDPLQQDTMEEEEEEAPFNGGGEIEEVEEMMMYKKLESRFRRVTLLDLFMADQLQQPPPATADEDEFAVQDNEQVAMEFNNNNNNKTTTKKRILYGKLAAAIGGRNPKPKKDVPVPPLKKLHRFMTKMMEKKIHPDMEARLQNKCKVMTLNDDVPSSINDQYYTESAYLLPTQGITV